MIILDTNVVSEVMRPVPSPQVLDWIDTVPSNELFTTAITVAEIYYGVEVLTKSKRRDALLAASDAIFDGDFRDRVLAFNAGAARVFSQISARRRATGRPISQSDAQIAAIVQLHGGTLATHNTRDFEGCGVRLIDPWTT